jgi:membrane protease YdiL (CAAX protease family)
MSEQEPLSLPELPSIEGARTPEALAAPPHPGAGWALLWSLGVILASQVPGAVAAVAAFFVVILVSGQPLPEDSGAFLEGPAGQAAIIVGLAVSHGIILVLALVLLRLCAGPGWARQVAWRLPAWHQAAGVALMFPAVTILATGLHLVLTRWLHVPSLKDLAGLPDMGEMEGMFRQWPAVVAVFLVGVVPAFSEELWCRAFLGRGLVGQHGYVLGVIVTSLLFGLIHIDPAQGAMAAGMGLVLHTAYLLTRSLWAPMLLHFLNNGTAVLLSRFPRVVELEKSLGPAHWPMFACAGVVLALGVYFLWSGRARLVTPPGEPAWEPPFPGVACPPADSPTRVRAPVPGVAAWAGLLVSSCALAWLVWASLP